MRSLPDTVTVADFFLHAVLSLESVNHVGVTATAQPLRWFGSILCTEAIF